MLAVQIGVAIWVFESCIKFSDCLEEPTAFIFRMTEVMTNMFLLPKRRNIWLRGVETQNWPQFKEIFLFSISGMSICVTKLYGNFVDTSEPVG
jgi:hypothetical protein